jgi:hypothetical protein
MEQSRYISAYLERLLIKKEGYLLEIRNLESTIIPTGQVVIRNKGDGMVSGGAPVLHLDMLRRGLASEEAIAALTNSIDFAAPQSMEAYARAAMEAHGLIWEAEPSWSRA